MILSTFLDSVIKKNESDKRFKTSWHQHKIADPWYYQAINTTDSDWKITAFAESKSLLS